MELAQTALGRPGTCAARVLAALLTLALATRSWQVPHTSCHRAPHTSCHRRPASGPRPETRTSYWMKLLAQIFTLLLNSLQKLLTWSQLWGGMILTRCLDVRVGSRGTGAEISAFFTAGTLSWPTHPSVFWTGQRRRSTGGARTLT